MKRFRSGAALALALAAGMWAVQGPSAADSAKEPSVKEIMTKAHKGGSSLLAGVGKDLKAADPDWTDLQAKSKELVKLGTSLGKADPPKGEKDSWETLTKGYLGFAKDLETATEKKDKDAAAAAQKKLAGSCGACHKAHKP
jgi:cytochrome c556